MDFSWIKKLFGIKSYKQNDNVDISTIDTSFIKAPKLSDLSKENQDRVMVYFNEIKYENYETIVKYSDSLLERSNREIDFFVHDLEDSIKDISSIIKEVSKDNHFKLLLYKEEIKLSIDEITKIEEEAELRLIALDMYIKKEEKRKYDFLGIFGKAERLRYLSDKSSLLNERQRLLVTIKLIRQHLQIIYNTLKNNKELLEQMELYFTNSSSFNTMYCDSRIVMVHAQELLNLKRLIDKNNCDELEQLEKNSETYHRMILTRKLANISIDEYDKIHESLEYQKVIHLLAKEKRKIKQYAYMHRNDYKTIISEINTIVSKYENMPSNAWNLGELYDSIGNFRKRINEYFYLCKKHLSDNLINEVINSFLNLSYYNYIKNGKLFSDKKIYPQMEKPKRPVPRKGEINEFLIPFDIKDIIDKNKEISHYNKLLFDLLKKIENKYGIKYGVLQGLLQEYSKSMDVNIERKKNNEIPYLYDILNENFDIFNLDIIIHWPSNYSYDYVKKAFSFINKIFCENDNIDNTYYFCTKPFISIENLFYLLKFLNSEKYNLADLFMIEIYLNKNEINKNNDSEIGIRSFKINEILVKSYLKKLERDYDERILVIPPIIEFNSLITYGYKNILNSVDDELNINNNTIGIYVSNWSQVNMINRALWLNPSQIKYLFMNEDLFNELRNNGIGKRNAKIIVVPNEFKYSELSSYLDRELEKESKEEKVLSKR